MAVNRMVLNETSYFGPGARKVIMDEIKRRGFKKAFVVTDKDLIKFHVAEMVLHELEIAGFPYQIYDNVKQNPTVANVQQGVDSFKNSEADFLIAIGGGSPIDTAKGIGIIVNNPEFYDVCSLEGVAATKKPSVPIIALPTTAGTAAEVTINYVITDEKKTKKMVCVDPHDIPVLAIVDPELMLSMPKGLTAATGMDALTHAIEGYITKGAWEMSDTFSLKAIRMIARHLEKAVMACGCRYQHHARHASHRGKAMGDAFGNEQPISRLYFNLLHVDQEQQPPFADAEDLVLLKRDVRRRALIRLYRHCHDGHGCSFATEQDFGIDAREADGGVGGEYAACRRSRMRGDVHDVVSLLSGPTVPHQSKHHYLASSAIIIYYSEQ